MKEKVFIGEQICLRPTPDQLEIIWEACKLCGYPQNGEGVLRLLIDQLTADVDDEDDDERPPKDSPLTKIVEYYRDNPDKLKTTIDFGRALFRGLKK